MADFPASKSSDALVGVACVGVGLILAGWLVAIILLIHGAATKDLWEVIWGGVLIVILLIVRGFTGRALR